MIFNCIDREIREINRSRSRKPEVLATTKVCTPPKKLLIYFSRSRLMGIEHVGKGMGIEHVGKGTSGGATLEVGLMNRLMPVVPPEILYKNSRQDFHGKRIDIAGVVKTIQGSKSPWDLMYLLFSKNIMNFSNIPRDPCDFGPEPGF